jgi:hydroxymethylpyrimidine pyrophosphatase-like HAD family hydrolase
MVAQKAKLAIPAICYNGAVVFAPGESSILSTRNIPIDDVLNLRERFRDTG